MSKAEEVVEQNKDGVKEMVRQAKLLVAEVRASEEAADTKDQVCKL